MPWSSPKPLKRHLKMPGDTAPCLCGSGAAFASCCKEHLPGLEQGKAFAIALRTKNLDGALTAARADFTQHAIWHATNTAPAMRAGIVGLGMVVESDIRCMSDYADRIAETLYRLGRSAEIPLMLERLRPLIDDPRWVRKVQYLQAETLWMATDDRAAARREFSKLGPLTPAESDVDILRLGVNLLAGELTFARALKLCDRILELSDDIDDQLRFRAAKAARYLTHGDEGQAADELESALALELGGEDAELDPTTQWILSWILTHLALMRRDEAIFRRAHALLRIRLEHPELTPIGKARITEEVADLYRMGSLPAEAEAAYRASLALAPSSRGEIFLAQSISFQDRAAEADERLRAIQTAHLDPNEYEDWLFTSAGVAVQMGDRTALEDVERRLRDHKSADPYFEQRRLKLVVAVGDALTAGANATLVERMRALVATPVKAFNRYVMAEPNVAGLGLRVNNMLEDLTKPRARRPRRRR